MAETVETAIYRVQLWRLVTFQFLHFDAWHLLFNMLFLYYYGPILERSMHRRPFVVFYLVSGLGGAGLYLLLWKLHLLNVGPASTLMKIYGFTIQQAENYTKTADNKRTTLEDIHLLNHVA